MNPAQDVPSVTARKTPKTLKIEKALKAISFNPWVLSCAEHHKSVNWGTILKR
jgi:hypothetical protein